MSWISENYEKAALGGAAIVAVALVGFSIKSHKDANAEYALELPKPNTDANVSGLDHIAEVVECFESEHEIARSSVNGREVDLFTSVPIVVKAGDLTEPIDLLKDGDIHEGIKNEFWTKHGIDPSFENTPHLDPDKDGFTNKEEAMADTSPVDYNSHPDVVAKLMVVNVATEQVHIKASSHKGGSTFRLENKNGDRINRTKLEPIAPGGMIAFVGEKMKDRFKFAAIAGGNLKGFVWTIADMKPNKLGVTYQFTRKGALVGDPDRNVGIMDSTVEFKLMALDGASKTFKAEENTSFELPVKGGEEMKSYLFKSINLAEKEVTIEHKAADGVVVESKINF